MLTIDDFTGVPPDLTCASTYRVAGNPYVGQGCGDGVCDSDETCDSCAADCGQCPAGCGDGVCAGTESCTTCPSDCGTCACVRGDGTCTGSTVCVSGVCEPIFNRTWRITIVSASVPTTDPLGESWDIGGGAPDLFAQIDINGSVVAQTSVANDVFSTTWNQHYDHFLVSGDTLTTWLWDEDVSDDDYIHGCGGPALTTAQLRNGIFECTQNGATLSARLDPR